MSTTPALLVALLYPEPQTASLLPATPPLSPIARGFFPNLRTRSRPKPPPRAPRCAAGSLAFPGACGFGWESIAHPNRKYFLAPHGAADCESLCGGALVDTMEECYDASEAMREPCGEVEGLGAEEDWDGPFGCHVQLYNARGKKASKSYGNFQFNVQEDGKKVVRDHVLVCRAEGSKVAEGSKLVKGSQLTEGSTDPPDPESPKSRRKQTPAVAGDPAGCDRSRCNSLGISGRPTAGDCCAPWGELKACLGEGWYPTPARSPAHPPCTLTSARPPLPPPCPPVHPPCPCTLTSTPSPLPRADPICTLFVRGDRSAGFTCCPSEGAPVVGGGMSPGMRPPPTIKASKGISPQWMIVIVLMGSTLVLALGAAIVGGIMLTCNCCPFRAQRNRLQLRPYNSGVPYSGAPLQFASAVGVGAGGVQMLHGQMLHGQMLPGQVRPGQMLPAAWPHGTVIGRPIYQTEDGQLLQMAPTTPLAPAPPRAFEAAPVFVSAEPVGMGGATPARGGAQRDSPGAAVQLGDSNPDANQDANPALVPRVVPEPPEPQDTVSASPQQSEPPASPRVAEQGGRAQPDAAAATFAYGRADAAAVDDEGGAPAVPSLSSYMASLSR